MGAERQENLAALLRDEAGRLSVKLQRIFARRDGRARKPTET
jgi:hypothetical protein